MRPCDRGMLQTAAVGPDYKGGVRPSELRIGVISSFFKIHCISQKLLSAVITRGLLVWQKPSFYFTIEPQSGLKVALPLFLWVTSFGKWICSVGKDGPCATFLILLEIWQSSPERKEKRAALLDKGSFWEKKPPEQSQLFLSCSGPFRLLPAGRHRGRKASVSSWLNVCSEHVCGTQKEQFEKDAEQDISLLQKNRVRYLR